MGVRQGWRAGERERERERERANSRSACGAAEFHVSNNAAELRGSAGQLHNVRKGGWERETDRKEETGEKKGNLG